MEAMPLTEGVFYILISVGEPNHGYGIMQNTEKLSGGRVKLAAGTLYGALNSLVEKQWIKALPSAENSRKKEYVITEQGKAVVCAELLRLKELLNNGIEAAEKWTKSEEE